MIVIPNINYFSKIYNLSDNFTHTTAVDTDFDWYSRDLLVRPLILMHKDESINFNDSPIDVGDKLFFGDKIPFPVSKLHKLTKRVKRTVNINNCDTLVIEDSYLQFDNFSNSYKYIIAIDPENFAHINLSCPYWEIDENQYKRYEDHFGADNVYIVNFLRKDIDYNNLCILEQCKNKKIASLSSLSRFLIPDLDSLDKENFEYYSALLTSDSEDSVALALEALTYYNLEPWKSHLIITMFKTPILNNIAYKYLKFQLGNSLDFTTRFYRANVDYIFNGGYYSNVVFNVIKGFYSDPNSSKELMDNTKELIKQRILTIIQNNSDIMDDLNLINCTISIDDPNGTSDTSN